MAPAGTSCRSETLEPTGSGSATRSACASGPASTWRSTGSTCRSTPDGEQTFTELLEVAPGPACRWWETTIRLTMPTTGYRFLVVTPDGHWWLNGSGRHAAAPTDAEDFRLVAGFDPPAWLAEPRLLPGLPGPVRERRPGQRHRRRRMDLSRDGRPTSALGRGARLRCRGDGRILRWRPARASRAGSTTCVDLGVNAIYLNPVFEARSNHGYDTIDYGRIAGSLRRG